MSSILLTSIISITIALISYLVVFFMNHRGGQLTRAQLGVLVLGLATDIIGTYMMSLLAEGWRFDLHSILGYAALLMMLAMTAYGLIAIRHEDDQKRIKFGKIYRPVVIIWVASYLTGVLLGIEKLN